MIGIERHGDKRLPSFRRRHNPAFQPRKPVIKSSDGVLSRRIQCRVLGRTPPTALIGGQWAVSPRFPSDPTQAGASRASGPGGLGSLPTRGSHRPVPARIRA
jgi:hypothetical protein